MSSLGSAQAQTNGEASDGKRATTELERRCLERGESQACKRAADLLARKRGEAATTRARRFRELSCRLGHADVCIDLAKEHQSEKELDDAVEWFELACWGRETSGCIPLRRLCSRSNVPACLAMAEAEGTRLYRPDATAAERAKKVERYEGYADIRARVSCHHDGSMRNCYWTAWLLLRGKGPSDDPNEQRTLATDLFEKSCDGGVHEACVALAGHYQHGVGVDADEERALEILTESCDADHLPACVELARAYRQGTGVDVDEEESASLLDAACASGHAAACEERASSLFARGTCMREELRTIISECKSKRRRKGCTRNGARKYAAVECVEKKKANSGEILRLLVRACELGSASVCNELGHRYSKGSDGLTKNPHRAMRYFRQACFSGRESSCFRLAKEVAKTSPSKAEAHYELACERGAARACSVLEKREGFEAAAPPESMDTSAPSEVDR